MAELLLPVAPPNKSLPDSSIQPPPQRPDFRAFGIDGSISVPDLVSPNKSQIGAQVVNHGISAELIQAMQAVAAEFFRLPAEEKLPLYSDDPTKKVRLSTCFNVEKKNLPLASRNLVSKYILGFLLLSFIPLSLGREQIYSKKELGEQEQYNNYTNGPELELTNGLPSQTDSNAGNISLENPQVNPQANTGAQLQPLSNGKNESVCHKAVVSKNSSEVLGEQDQHNNNTRCPEFELTNGLPSLTESNAGNISLENPQVKPQANTSAQLQPLSNGNYSPRRLERGRTALNTPTLHHGPQVPDPQVLSDGIAANSQPNTFVINIGDESQPLGNGIYRPRRPERGRTALNTPTLHQGPQVPDPQVLSDGIAVNLQLNININGQLQHNEAGVEREEGEGEDFLLKLMYTEGTSFMTLALGCFINMPCALSEHDDLKMAFYASLITVFLFGLGLALFSQLSQRPAVGSRRSRLREIVLMIVALAPLLMAVVIVRLAKSRS